MEQHSERVDIIMTKAELAEFARTVAQEVLGRLEARRAVHADEPVIVSGPLSVNIPAHEVLLDGTEVKLKTREFALLSALARNLGRVLTREQLLTLAWPEPEHVDDRTVDIHVRRVRLALGDAARLLETVHGVGYKLTKARLTPEQGT